MNILCFKRKKLIKKKIVNELRNNNEIMNK